MRAAAETVHAAVLSARWLGLERGFFMVTGSRLGFVADTKAPARFARLGRFAWPARAFAIFSLTVEFRKVYDGTAAQVKPFLWPSRKTKGKPNRILTEANEDNEEGRDRRIGRENAQKAQNFLPQRNANGRRWHCIQ